MHGIALSRALTGHFVHLAVLAPETQWCGQSTTTHFDLAGMGAIVKFSMARQNLNKQLLHSFLALARISAFDFVSLATYRAEAAR